jgi:cytochrome c biogenesis protein CcmG/thiol:disulfide interchange protein DsbE
MQALTGLAATLLLLVAPSPPANASGPGEVLDLTAFKGQVVYLDFWASWCAPCRESFPWMNGLQGELGAHGLVVIAVNVDRERADADRFLREHPAQFRIVYDPDGQLPEKYGVRGMPTSFLIDRDGHIQARHEGFLLRDRDALRQQVRALVLVH